MNIEIKGLGKKFEINKREHIALENVNLTIKKGEFVCILGPSGCGKSTLLNVLAGLEIPSEGNITFDGKSSKEIGSERAIVFQDGALFPWLNVIDNVKFGMKIKNISEEEANEKAMKYLKMVHLTNFANSSISELSGGMRQRVSIARALTLDSNLILMDEPFSALDAQTKTLLQTEIQKIWYETGKTIVFITHNIEEAVMLADRVIVMGTRPGKVKKEFPIELGRPRTQGSSDVSYMVKRIFDVIKEEVEKVAKAEYDNDWSLEKDEILFNSDNNLGINL
ncbi:MAG: ABC transporter ATP-binding protein [Fusobacteriaceae bacterium]|nr:ABC transporter ATP-binding protein [Fusobacteriaceae bacterium]